MKFKVGDKVKTLKGSHLGTINYISDSNYPYIVRWDNGMSSAYMPSELELAQPEVSKEPVPGKFYRTRGGDKVFYVGVEANGFFVYHSMDGKYFHYSTPTKYCKYRQIENDIVCEWAEAITLPSLEIKRWAVVFKNKDDRGVCYADFPTELSAEDYIQESRFGQDLEIVELTGTLPERKQ